MYDLIGIYLPSKYFRIEKSNNEYHVYFPDDSTMKNLFFIVLEKDVIIENEGIKIQSNNRLLTFVLNKERQVFSQYEWIKIKTYIERYIRIKEGKVR